MMAAVEEPVTPVLVLDRLPGDVPNRLDARAAQIGELLRVAFGGRLRVIAGIDSRSTVAERWRKAGVEILSGPIDTDASLADCAGEFELITIVAPAAAQRWLRAVGRWQPQAVVVVDALALASLDRSIVPSLFDHSEERAGATTVETVRRELDDALLTRADLVTTPSPELLPLPVHAPVVTLPWGGPPSIESPSLDRTGVAMVGEPHRGVLDPVESAADLLGRALIGRDDQVVVAADCLTAASTSALDDPTVVPALDWAGTVSAAAALAVTHVYGPPNEPLILAALALGTPVVATPHAAGTLPNCPPGLTLTGAADEVRHVLAGLLDDPGQRRSAEAAAHRLADAWSPNADELMARTLVAALESIGVATSPVRVPAIPAVDPWIVSTVDRRRPPEPIFRRRELLGWEPDAAELAYRPLISVVMPCYDTDPALLGEAIESVRAQTYQRWELCIVDDASPGRAVGALAEEYSRRDSRIRFRRLLENQGIAGASDAAVAMSEGEFVAFLDHDDLLTADALTWVVAALNEDPGIDALYSDESKINADGNWVDTYHKPAWAPELHLAYNYVTHLRVYRRAVIERVGGHRKGFDGSQDYDLALRVAEVTDRIAHIPRVLYGWRMVEGSAALAIDEKPAAWFRGRTAIEDALERRGISGRVEPAMDPGAYRVRYEHDAEPEVTIIIPTRDRAELVRACVEAIESTTEYRSWRYLVVDNDSVEPDAHQLFRELERDHGATIVRYPHRFSYARMMNLGVEVADADLVLLLNNDATVQNADWLSSMVELAMRGDVGAVGARLSFPNGAVQHEGINLGVGGCAANVCNNQYFSLGKLVHEYAAVTAACVMLRPEVFWQVGGFDERLRVAFNDVDLTMRIHRAGYRIMYTPHAHLVHAESSSRGSLHPQEDEDFFIKRWGPWRDLIDPFYNPNLSRWHPYQLLADDVRS